MESDSDAGFLGDLEAFARLTNSPAGWQESTEVRDIELLSEFARLAPAARRLVNRLLDQPQATDWQELYARRDGRELAEWMLSLPVFANSRSLL